ncbi:MAG: hypothetical protein R3F62_20200 [Planctomycetota bacterium]
MTRLLFCFAFLAAGGCLAQAPLPADEKEVPRDFPEPAPTPPQPVFELAPGPEGSVDAATEVYAYGPGAWHEGRPGFKPWLTVDGDFQLEDFPYAQPGGYTSVFFVRRGCFPEHRVIERTQDDTPTPEALGPLALDELTPGRAGLLVVVVEHQASGIVRYLRHKVIVTPITTEDGEKVEHETSGKNGLRLDLAPGRYRVQLDNTPDMPYISDPQEFVLLPDTSRPVVFSVEAPAGD